MTVKPRLQQEVEAAWPAMSAAVTAGLKPSDTDTKLGDVVTVTKQHSDLARYVRLSWAAHGFYDDLKVSGLTARPGDVSQLRVEHSVPIEEIENGVGEEVRHSVEDWARSARRAELGWVLQRTIRKAPWLALDGQALKGLGGGMRIVATQHVEGLKKASTDAGVEYVDCRVNAGTGVKALVYEIDRFSVSRLEDFSLSYEYLPHGSGVRLALTARVLLRGFGMPTRAKKCREVGPFASSTGG